MRPVRRNFDARRAFETPDAATYIPANDRAAELFASSEVLTQYLHDDGTLRVPVEQIEQVERVMSDAVLWIDRYDPETGALVSPPAAGAVDLQLFEGEIDGYPVVFGAVLTGRAEEVLRIDRLHEFDGKRHFGFVDPTGRGRPPRGAAFWPATEEALARLTVEHLTLDEYEARYPSAVAYARGLVTDLRQNGPGVLGVLAMVLEEAIAAQEREEEEEREYPVTPHAEPGTLVRYDGQVGGYPVALFVPSAEAVGALRPLLDGGHLVPEWLDDGSLHFGIADPTGQGRHYTESLIWARIEELVGPAGIAVVDRPIEEFAALWPGTLARISSAVEEIQDPGQEAPEGYGPDIIEYGGPDPDFPGAALMIVQPVTARAIEAFSEVGGFFRLGDGVSIGFFSLPEDGESEIREMPGPARLRREAYRPGFRVEVRPLSEFEPQHPLMSVLPDEGDTDVVVGAEPAGCGCTVAIAQTKRGLRVLLSMGEVDPDGAGHSMRLPQDIRSAILEQDPTLAVEVRPSRATAEA